MKPIAWKTLLLCLAISLGTGLVSGLLTMGSMQTYQMLVKPPLSPPGFLFPVVWTVLFFLMGISSYLVAVSGCEGRKKALTVYGVQLAINFLWPIFFFNLEAYLFSFFWLVLLWAAVLYMIILFYRCRKSAAYLQLPYLLWLTFAGYLNLMVYILNR